MLPSSEGKSVSNSSASTQVRGVAAAIPWRKHVFCPLQLMEKTFTLQLWRPPGQSRWTCALEEAAASSEELRLEQVSLPKTAAHREPHRSSSS